MNASVINAYINNFEIFFARIDVKYILSRPPADWTGLCGRITKEILADFIGSVEKPSIDDELLICICGSDEFTNLINGSVPRFNSNRILQAIVFITEQFFTKNQDCFNIAVLLSPLFW